jgi:hypothetical protein
MIADVIESGGWNGPGRDVLLYTGRGELVKGSILLVEVLRAIRAEPRTRRLSVVILTSSDEQQDLTKGYDFGVNSYVRKPVDFQEFTEAIRLLGMYWLVLNRTPANPGQGSS